MFEQIIMDSNVAAALNWSVELGSMSMPKSLNNKNIRAKFIDSFDKNFGGKVFENYHQSQDKKGEFIRLIANFTKKYLNDIFGSDNEIGGLVLGLWGSCTITSKQIGIRRKEITPEVRKERFTILDPLLGKNQTFRMGMETAVSYCKLRNEKFSLEGIPPESPARG